MSTASTTTDNGAPAPPAKTEAPPKKHTNMLLMLSYATIVALWVGCQFILIPYVVNLLVLVTCILYMGCHWSLILLQEEEEGEGADGSGDGSSSVPQGETLTKEDAMQFPIVGSCSLFGLYLAFKFLNRDLVNLLIGVYFLLVGCFAVTATVAPALSALLPQPPSKGEGSGGGFLDRSWKIDYEKDFKGLEFLKPIFGSGEENDADEKLIQIDWEFTGFDLLAMIPSAILCGIYFKTKHWALNNVLGICFCIQGIERFSLGTYKIGAILLIGLFFYDIFWVFGTEVMVTVAKNLDGPIKILFPRTLVPNEETGKIELSLLGLGDIVIPGFFLALLLRFDAHKAEFAKGQKGPVDVHVPFPKPYFHSCLVGYCLGMATTMFVMIQFEAAQPALLYLVPACLGSSTLCAVMRGEWKELLEYSEEKEEEEAAEGDDKDKETKEESTTKEGEKEVDPATAKKDN